MKSQYALILFLLLVFTAAGIACRRQHLSSQRLVGKLVINGACGNYAVQVISGNIDPSRLLASWTDGDTTYTNVFAVNNRCNFGQYGLKQGESFSFLLNDSLVVQTCMSCEIVVPVPDVSNTVTGVEPLP
jgi:hypothetical protein